MTATPDEPKQGGAHRFATALVGKAQALFHGLGPRATIACAYVAIAIFTFGHSASAKHHCIDWAAHENIPCRTAGTALMALGAGVLWPLYWSWEAQS